jgi:hypothetical protein
VPKDKDQVLVGVGALYVAPVGEPFPSHFSTPAGLWYHVGYTDGGVTVEYATEEAEIEVDQELDPVKIIETGRSLTVAATLAQINGRLLQEAFAGGNLTAVDPDGVPGTGDEYEAYTPPAIGASVARALLFDGVDETSRPVRLMVPEAKVQGTRTIGFVKDNKANIQVTWRMLVPSAGGDPFTIRVKNL